MTTTEVTDHGNDAQIDIQVKAVDIFGTESGTSGAGANAATLFVQPTDIDDFPGLLSNLYLVPVVVGLTITNDDPDGDSISWNAHSLWYDGTEYEIDAGNTSNTYVYFKDLATTYVESDTHPADSGGEADWDTTEDFIIMVNDSGSGQAAWYAMANAVIGSAYIKAAAIQDLHVDEISGTKITADTIAGSKIVSGAIDLDHLDAAVAYEMSTSYNFVKNGEFNKDANYTTDPTDWDVSLTNGPVTYAMTTIPTPAATYGCPWDINNGWCFYGSTSASNQRILLTSSDFIPVNNDLDYCLSAWVRGYDGTRNMYLGLSYYDIDYDPCAPTAYQWMTASAYSPATSWHQIEGVCYNSSSGETNLFPADCVYVKVSCYVQLDADGANLISRIALQEGLYPQRGVTIIDGGHIYTGTVTADQIAADTITADEISGTGFGTLTITSGKIVINTTDALEIEGSGNMRLATGGDIIFAADDSSPSKIIYEDSGAGSYDIEISRAATYDRLYVIPDTTNTCQLMLGSTSNRFDYLTGSARYISLEALHSSDYAELLLFANNYTKLSYTDSVNGESAISLYPDNTIRIETDDFRPDSDGDTNLGLLLIGGLPPMRLKSISKATPAPAMSGWALLPIHARPAPPTGFIFITPIIPALLAIISTALIPAGRIFMFRATAIATTPTAPMAPFLTNG